MTPFIHIQVSLLTLRRFALTGLLLLMTLVLTGQSSYTQLVPYQQNGLWGYMNQERVVVIRPQFSSADFFAVWQEKETGAVVKKDGKYGLVDTLGKVFIPIKFDSIRRHPIQTTKGFFWETHKNGKVRYFNTAGKKLRQPKGRRPIFCYTGMGSHCIQFKTEKDLSWLDSSQQTNYEYRNMSFDTIAGQISRHFDTIQVRLDSIIYPYSFHNDKEILFRADGKINICQIIKKDHKTLYHRCTGFKYDEVDYIDCQPIFTTDTYEPVLKVRAGHQWGLLAFHKMSPSERSNYLDTNTWEVLPVKHQQIIRKQQHYFFVEYAPGQFGYAYWSRFSPLRTFW